MKPRLNTVRHLHKPSPLTGSEPWRARPSCSVQARQQSLQRLWPNPSPGKFSMNSSITIRIVRSYRDVFQLHPRLDVLIIIKVIASHIREAKLLIERDSFIQGAQRYPRTEGTWQQSAPLECPLHKRFSITAATAPRNHCNAGNVELCIFGVELIAHEAAKTLCLVLCIHQQRKSPASIGGFVDAVLPKERLLGQFANVL
mmetsp:Transcript_31185/g.58527  ORF Transcript_31185/g.58527 Transcript_31185/m.58527 type:complete len:200 (-) Transcript_31185:691-1290(-)